MLWSSSLTFQSCLIHTYTYIHGNQYHCTSSFTLCLCMFEMCNYFWPNNISPTHMVRTCVCTIGVHKCCIKSSLILFVRGILRVEKFVFDISILLDMYTWKPTPLYFFYSRFVYALKCTIIFGQKYLINSRWLELEHVQKVYINVPKTLNNLLMSTCAVLSKNPIRKIGDALLKVQSITKVGGAPTCWTPLMPISVLYSCCSWNLSWFQLSLSHCQLEGIDTSLRSCLELSELRLAHNEIKVCF